jgi:hypothetical protein
MQGGPQGFAGLTLPPVRTQPASGQGTPQHPVLVQSPQGRGEQQHAGAGSPAAAAGSPPQSARSWARGQQQPASPLSPRGSSAGAACRRRTGSGSGLTALGPGGGQTPHGQTPRPLHPGMERSQSQQSDVSVHMSIYVSQGRFKVCVLGGWVEGGRGRMFGPWLAGQPSWVGSTAQQWRCRAGLPVFMLWTCAFAVL